METWRHVWRTGFLPLFSTGTLERLRKALLADSYTLLTGASFEPPALQMNMKEAVERCCPVAMAAIFENQYPSIHAASVDDAEVYFAQACLEAGNRLGEHSQVRHFMNWVDEGNRHHVFKALAAEITVNLVARATKLPPAA
jgi:hypothetical protein